MQSGRHLLAIAALVGSSSVSLRPLGAQSSAPPSIRLERPSARLTWRSGVPDAREDGAAVSGLGATFHARAGLALAWRAFTLRLVPELVATENRGFPSLAARDPSRDPLSSPFYAGQHSADLPSRHGRGSLLFLAPGESGLWWRHQRGSIALTSSLAEWGPTPGEGLVLGRSAPGIPRVEASHRLASFAGAGELHGRIFAGTVRESDRFDDDADNDRRRVSGARLEYRTAGSSLGSTVGIARTVMDARAGRDALASPAAPFIKGGRDSTLELLSVDATVLHARTGTIGWTELARQAPLRGLGAFLRMPTEGIAFRAGVEQRLAVTSRATWTADVEFVRLDQSGVRVGEPAQDLYTSPDVAQGWTHRGQPLGSGLGPGGQRQFMRLRRAGSRWDIAAFAERARWNDDALYREAAPFSDRHDVTLSGGISIARALGDYEAMGSVSGGKRLNYLFQGASSAPGGSAVDRAVLEVGITLRPRRSDRVVASPSQP